MSEQPKRIRLSPQQIVLMRETLSGCPASVRDTADRVGRGEVVADNAANAVVDALVAAMLEDAYEGLTARGCQIDDIIGVVQQMSEGFYR